MRSDKTFKGLFRRHVFFSQFIRFANIFQNIERLRIKNRYIAAFAFVISKPNLLLTFFKYFRRCLLNFFFFFFFF